MLRFMTQMKSTVCVVFAPTRAGPPQRQESSIVPEHPQPKMAAPVESAQIRLGYLKALELLEGPIQRGEDAGVANPVLVF